MGLTACSETSVTEYQYSLRYNTDERSFQELHVRKAEMTQNFMKVGAFKMTALKKRNRNFERKFCITFKSDFDRIRHTKYRRSVTEWFWGSKIMDM
jgi:hypothetical protein